MNKLKTYFNWSTGKDSALALHYLLQDERYAVGQLVTTINKHHDRVTMHGLRRSLLLDQMSALGIPHRTIELPEQPDMETYNILMADATSALKSEGFSHAAFGDIFLEDLRAYRERQLAQFQVEAVFPLWQKDTLQLLQEFIDLGFKAIVVCVDASKLDASFAGRFLDESFLKDLPAHVDPCGENGEFHTFCFEGPIFKHAVPFEVGERVYREYPAPAGKGPEARSGFWYCDLLQHRGEHKKTPEIDRAF